MLPWRKEKHWLWIIFQVTKPQQKMDSISLHLRSKLSIEENMEKTWVSTTCKCFFHFFPAFTVLFEEQQISIALCSLSTKKQSNERHLPKPHLAELHGAEPFWVFPSLADPELLQIANRTMKRTQRNSTTGTTNPPSGHNFFAYK